MASEELFSQVSLWMVNVPVCLKFYTFSLYFILYLLVWIQIHNTVHKHFKNFSSVPVMD